jgi:hypothetical protein
LYCKVLTSLSIHVGGFIIGGANIAYQLPHHWVQRTQSHIVVSIKFVSLFSPPPFQSPSFLYSD